MLREEGNAGERWKTATGLISKKATLHVHHTFFVHFFDVVLHDYNVKLPETSSLHVLWRKCRRFSRFSLPLIFTLHWCPLAFLIFRFKTFHVVLPTKNCLLYFLSLAPDLCRLFSFWASLACRPLSLFLCVTLALYSKFVDMTINLSLILYKTRIQREFPLSVFIFIDSLVVSALQDAGGYAISRQNNIVLHLGCFTC